MNWVLIFNILAVSVSSLSHVQAVDKTSNPECEDLKNVQAAMKKAVKLVPGASVDCKPNKNCTGLICSGKMNSRSFHGTIILEGCHEPVRMFVHMNNKHLYVKDGFKRKVISKPFPVSIQVNLRKKNDVVYVNLKVLICIGTACLPFKILKNQKIRVHCNDSTVPTMLPSLNPWPVNPRVRKVSKNPECKGLDSTKNQVEKQFQQLKKLYPDAKITCHKANNCSDLQCSGVANKDHFNTTATIDYCSGPNVKLRLIVDVPNKNIHFNHSFQNGQSYQIMPLVSIKVNLIRDKNDRNIIYLTAAVVAFGFQTDIVRNMSIKVDPSHCHGDHEPYWTTPIPFVLKCLKMEVVANMIEERLSGKDSSKNPVKITKCEPQKNKQCSVVRCIGTQGENDFTFDASVNYCSSKPTLDFTLNPEGQKSRKFNFKNGSNQFLGHQLTVDMKKEGNSILTNVYLDKVSVLENAEIPYDPSQSYHCPVNGDPESKKSGHSLSSGGIVGVVIAVVILFAILIAIIVWIVRGKRQRVTRYNNLMMADDSDPLFFTSDPVA